MSGPYRCFRQGEMKKFAQLFVAPLLHYRHPNQSLDEFLNTTMFHRDERIIIRCRSRRPFEMPGLWMITPFRKIKNGAPRHVERYRDCFVRYDVTDPKRVEVETYMGQGGREYVFELTDVEWASVRRCLEPRGRGKDDFQKICP